MHRRSRFMSWWWIKTTGLPLPLRRVTDKVVGWISCLFAGHDVERGDAWCGWCGNHIVHIGETRCYACGKGLNRNG